MKVQISSKTENVQTSDDDSTVQIQIDAKYILKWLGWIPSAILIYLLIHIQSYPGFWIVPIGTLLGLAILLCWVVWAHTLFDKDT